MKQSLKGGNTLTTFLRSRKEKKKEDVRFHTSKLHVALSLTQLAAAVSSIVNNGSTEAHEMGVAVASAAALMTTVWAEAAEVLGAQRSQVMSSINSGQAIRTPVDMVALTATAATCTASYTLINVNSSIILFVITRPLKGFDLPSHSLFKNNTSPVEPDLERA